METFVLKEVRRLKSVVAETDDFELASELDAADQYLGQILSKLAEWEHRALKSLLQARLSGESTEAIREALSSMKQGKLW